MEQRSRKREDTPKTSNADNLPYRISGLEKAKTESGMTRDDIAALDRVIMKLKEKLAAKEQPKQEEKED